MDPSLPPADSLVRPWRTAAIIACGVAAVELVAVVGLAALLLGRPFLTRATASPAERRQARVEAAPDRAAPPRRAQRIPPAAPRLSRAQTSVLVLNGNGRPGAAAAEAERLRARGYPVAGVGNAPRTDYASTLVMYRPGFEPEARRLARDLGGASVAALDGLRPSDLHGAHAALILGR